MNYSEAQIVNALDDLAEALGTDGFGILERSGGGTSSGRRFKVRWCARGPQKG